MTGLFNMVCHFLFLKNNTALPVTTGLAVYRNRVSVALHKWLYRMIKKRLLPVKLEGKNQVILEFSIEYADDGALGIAFRQQALMASPILTDFQGTMCLAMRYLWRSDDRISGELSFKKDGIFEGTIRLQPHRWTVYRRSMTMTLKSKVMILSYFTRLHELCTMGDSCTG